MKHHCQCHSLASPIPSHPSLSGLLHSCQDIKTLKQVHATLIVSNGSIPTSAASKLMSLYAEFKDIHSVIWVFNKMKENPDTIMWNLIIRCHVDSGLFYSALLLYKRMRRLGVEHDGFTFPIVNRAISSFMCDIRTGKMVHCVAIQTGFAQDVYFGNTMIGVYVKCGSVLYARNLFDEMLHRDLVCWTSMISGYISEGQFNRACNLFNEMRMDFEPNPVTLIVVLQAICSPEMSGEGTHLHCYALKSGLMLYANVQNSILTMYIKTGDVEKVEDFSSEMDNKDAVSLNILISFYATMGDIFKVAAMFKSMQGEALCSWNIENITSVISAFAKSGYSAEGETMHSLVVKTGLADDVLLTTLLDFYAKSGKMNESAQVFREINSRSNITWGAVMSGLIQNGYFLEAVTSFQEMRMACLYPAPELLRNLVDAYANLGALRLGKGVHGHIIKNHYYQANNESSQLETSILNMYIKCGSISSALVCFERMPVKDLVTWTTMIEGLGSHGFGNVAVKLFYLMVDQRVQPNSVTFLSLLSACSHSGLVSEACRIYHSMKWVYGIEPGLGHYTCMVDLLGRHGQLQLALAMILKMSINPDSRIWGALLAASRVYANKTIGEYTAERLLEMEPDNVGYCTLLSNIKASVGKWDEVVEVRKVMDEKDLRKKPGWSCIEVNETVHGFVAGDRSHEKSSQINELLCSLNVVLQQF